MKRFIFLMLAAVCCALCPDIFSAEDIVISYSADQKNPAMLFRGIAGDAAMNERVGGYLRACGWFDMVSGGECNYSVSGQVSGNALKVSLSTGTGKTLKTFTISGYDSVEQAAALAVDTVLAELFGIPGICRSRIVFSADVGAGKRDIYMCDFDGRNIKRVTSNNTLSVEPVWTPGGNGIVYCYYGLSYTHLVEHRFDLGKSRRLTRYPGMNAGGAISPDGRYIAVVLTRNNQVDLFIRPVEGGDLIQLTNDRAVEASPAWTADGRKICFVSDKSGRPRLYLTSPSPRSAVQYLNLAGSERVTPDCSANGLLAYSARIGGDYVVAVASLNSDGSVQLMDVGLPGSPVLVPGEGPSWAPDGRHLVVSHDGVLYVLDTKLGKKRRLVGGSSRMYQPDWSPILK